MAFRSGLQRDPTDEMANAGQQITFTHIPTGRSVSFKAFVKDFSDDFTTSWNPVSVFGRMDEIHTYQGTTRVINITWDVVAASAKEAAENFQRVSELVKFLYPVYSRDSAGIDAATMVASPLIGIHYANLIQNTEGGHLVGAVGGFSNSPDFEMGFYDGDDGTMAAAGGLAPPSMENIYPKLIELACEFTVFHTEPLGFEGKSFRAGNQYPYRNQGGSHHSAGEIEMEGPPESLADSPSADPGGSSSAQAGETLE